MGKKHRVKRIEIDSWEDCLEENYGKDKVLDSGIQIYSLKVVIPVNLYLLSLAVAKKTESEFSFLAKGSWKGGAYTLEKEYLIPKQEVEWAQIEYDQEDLKKAKNELGFNVIVHRHPGGGGVFSDTDEETINSNFDCSILFSDGGFKTASLKFRLNDGLLMLETKDIEIGLEDAEIKGLENVKKKKRPLGTCKGWKGPISMPKGEGPYYPGEYGTSWPANLWERE